MTDLETSEGDVLFIGEPKANDEEHDKMRWSRGRVRLNVRVRVLGPGRDPSPCSPLFIEMCAMSSRPELPLDILPPILAQLSGPRDWHACALVSKVFNRAATPLLYRTLNSRMFHKVSLK